jgi:putative hydrolase of the HAD superfamily
MKYDAVIFDLFGTLVDNLRDGPYEQSIRQTGAAAGAEPEEFLRRWTDRRLTLRRTAGLFGTQAACIEHICREMGLAPADEDVRRAARVRSEFTRGCLLPRADAAETLRALRAAGLKLGLMSVCGPDTPKHWPGTPLAELFDEALFSPSVGLNKPDPQFYALACERLGVRPQRCLYVGDGASDELTGARRAGMAPVLICTPEEEQIVLARRDARRFADRRIASVREVLALVGNGADAHA